MAQRIFLATHNSFLLRVRAEGCGRIGEECRLGGLLNPAAGMVRRQRGGAVRAALYGRISTVDKGQDVELQLRDLRRYVEARGWIAHWEYIDAGVSGAKVRRPALEALLDDCRKRRVNVVLVWRLDRLGRSLKHLLMILDELRELGIAFVSYQENLDCTTAAGYLMFQLLGIFAEFERQLIRKRVRAGLANARAKGKVLGWPRRLVVQETVRELREPGGSLRLIAKTTGVSTSVVRQALERGRGKEEVFSLRT
jgi:DNA invertase Pin-like site-specific DNA recombinase